MSEISPWISLHSQNKAEKLPSTIAIDAVLSTDEEAALADQGTKRGLNSRHIQLILLGGAIGTGLFIGSGSALAQCGPASLLISYLIMSMFILSIMNQLSEMVTYLPLPGETTMYSLSRKYSSKAISMTCGYNLLYAMIMVAPAEITACGLLIRYWSDLNVAIWISIFIVCTVIINFLPVQVFGETEFWIASIKLICLTGLIILGVVIFFGGGPNQHHVLGFHYWNHPGSFVEHLVPGSTGKFLGCWTAVIKSGFSFVMSPEIVTLCSSETAHPRVNVPKAASRFVYRLGFFYIIGVIVIGIIVPSTDPRLLSGASDASASPYVIGLKLVGIKVLDHIVNACILTSAFSAGNSFVYAASRLLFSMALKGDTPRFFANTNRWGVPYNSVLLVSLFTLLAYLNCSNSAATVFTWLSNICTVSGFIEWMFVGITYVRFRKAIAYHGMEDRIPFRPKFQSVGAYVSILFFTILSLTNGYAVFIKGNWSVNDFFACYVTIGFIIVLYIIGHVKHREGRFFTPPEQVDVITGLKIAESEALEYVPKVPRNFLEKIYFWIC